MKEIESRLRHEYEGEDFLNEITEMFDEYLKDKSDRTWSCTYCAGIPWAIEDQEWAYSWLVRYPGATRANIRLKKDGTIMDFLIFKDLPECMQLYKPELREALNVYIGSKVDIGKLEMMLKKGD